MHDLIFATAVMLYWLLLAAAILHRWQWLRRPETRQRNKVRPEVFRILTPWVLVYFVGAKFVKAEISLVWLGITLVLVVVHSVLEGIALYQLKQENRTPKS